MTTFFLEIITPDRIAFQDQVNMVSVPSVTGILGILPNHVPLFTQLTSGELKINQGGKETFISLGEGYLQITSGKVTVLVTKALHADELDEQRLLKAKMEAEEALKNPPTPESVVATQSVLRGILTDLKIARRRKSPQIS